MARRKKDKVDEKKVAEGKLELAIIYRIIHFYTSKETTHEQRLSVWDAVKDIIIKPPDEPAPDETKEA